MSKKTYKKPEIITEASFQTPPPCDIGGRHFTSAYDTFLGHWGNRNELTHGTGIELGPRNSPCIYTYLCGNWSYWSHK
ncbi:MAG: hypothetical protein ABIE68_02640 [bacterium]